MEGMFNDIKEEATHTELTGTDKDKSKTATKASVCDKVVAELPTGCTTPCNPST
jgi:hypothetical protein